MHSGTNGQKGAVGLKNYASVNYVFKTPNVILNVSPENISSKLIL